MKICSECKEVKEIIEFRKRKASKDGLESRCKGCRRAADNLAYRSNPERKNQIIKSRSAKVKEAQLFVRSCLESTPCVDCGQDDADLLEYDHVRGTKKFGIGRMVGTGMSIDAIKREMDKCEVRCLYCHRKRTIKQLGWYSWVISPDSLSGKASLL